MTIEQGLTTIDTADSLENYPPPKILIRDIQKWLRVRFDGPFRDLGSTLTNEKQKDSVSCIPYSANVLAHEIFGDTVWEPATRGIDRMRWFTILCKQQAGVVR